MCFPFEKKTGLFSHKLLLKPGKLGASLQLAGDIEDKPAQGDRPSPLQDHHAIVVEAADGPDRFDGAQRFRAAKRFEGGLFFEKGRIGDEMTDRLAESVGLEPLGPNESGIGFRQDGEGKSNEKQRPQRQDFPVWPTGSS